MILGLQGTYESKCQELGLDTLEERRRKQDLLQAYKICSGKDRVWPELLFTRVGENPDRRTRFTYDRLNITVKRSRLDKRKNSYAVRVAEEWNDLGQSAKWPHKIEHELHKSTGRPRAYPDGSAKLLMEALESPR